MAGLTVRLKRPTARRSLGPTLLCLRPTSP